LLMLEHPCDLSIERRSSRSDAGATLATKAPLIPLTCLPAGWRSIAWAAKHRCGELMPSMGGPGRLPGNHGSRTMIAPAIWATCRFLVRPAMDLRDFRWGDRLVRAFVPRGHRL